MQIPGVANYEDVASERVYGAQQSLEMEDFMNLLLQELSHQDPLEPMDNKEFIGQMTQFNALAQLTGLNDKLDEVVTAQRSMQNATFTNMIGKIVKVDGNNTTYLSDSADISYDLGSDATTAKLFVRDANGNIIFAEELGEQAEGGYSFTWDGKDMKGNQMDEGSYSYDVKAFEIDGSPVQVSTWSSGKITNVVYGEGGTTFVMDGSREIYLDEILSIAE